MYNVSYLSRLYKPVIEYALFSGRYHDPGHMDLSEWGAFIEMRLNEDFTEIHEPAKAFIYAVRKKHNYNTDKDHIVLIRARKGNVIREIALEPLFDEKARATLQLMD